jgi:hypothetical protein
LIDLGIWVADEHFCSNLFDYSPITVIAAANIFTPEEGNKRRRYEKTKKKDI